MIFFSKIYFALINVFRQISKNKGIDNDRDKEKWSGVGVSEFIRHRSTFPNPAPGGSTNADRKLKNGRTTVVVEQNF